MTDLKIIFLEVTNVSPSILIPFYDEDSSTLFLAGKGENVITAYEVGNSCFVDVTDVMTWFDDFGDKLTKYYNRFDFSRQFNVSKACKAFENLTENFSISHDH